MNSILRSIAEEAGFKIFKDKIVAADNGSSGDATQCLEKFVKLLIEDILKITEPMPNSGDVDDVRLAQVQQEIKEKYLK